MKDTIQSTLESFPPTVIRLLARTGTGNGSRRLTHHEIAERGGLTYEKVRELSAMDSWAKVHIGDADAFLRGCGVTLRNLWKHRAFLRRSLDPRRTREPLAYAKRRGAGQRPPAPEILVAAALSRGRSRSARRAASASPASAH